MCTPLLPQTLYSFATVGGGILFLFAPILLVCGGAPSYRPIREGGGGGDSEHDVNLRPLFLIHLLKPHRGPALVMLSSSSCPIACLLIAY